MRFGARMTVLAVAFMVMFGLLGLRLWFIQVAEGQEAAEKVQEQQWVTIPTQAPRGDIYDRNGTLLATSRFVPSVVVDRRRLQPDDRDQLVQRLSSLLEIPPGDIDAMYSAAGVNGRFRVALIDDITAYRISEQLRDLPGVYIEKVPERVYLSGDTMAHVVGHLGFPSADDLEARSDLDPNVRIGKLGVERVYDEYLQGTPGELAYRVNRTGEVLEERPERAALPGATVYTTLDLSLQEEVERALSQGVELSNELKQEARRKGRRANAANRTERAAAVVLDVDTFEVLAMASNPDFDPQLFVSGINSRTFEALNESGAFLNLAVSGGYPPASTFKAVTYATKVTEGLRLGGPNADPANDRALCNGLVEFPLNDGSQQVKKDWYYGRTLGWLDLHSALQYSCNIYFWSVALGVWEQWKGTPRENVIQDMARDLGFGSKTGIDLTGEASGLVPDRALFEEWKQIQLEDEDAPVLLAPERLETASPWFGGDLMDFAIGQGSTVATPLQVAAGYAAIANGGRVMTPHVVSQIRDRAGELVYSAAPGVVNDLAFDPGFVDSFLTDLNRVVTRGTARKAFDGFGSSVDRVGGKTGTGQAGGKDNHAWFAGVAPVDDPKWVVVVLVEEGGSGGAVAAPVARQIMQYLMGEDLDPIVAGEVAD